MGYEYVRSRARRYDASLDATMPSGMLSSCAWLLACSNANGSIGRPPHNAPSNSLLLDLPTEDSTLLTPGLVRKKKSGKLVKGAFYGGQVFYSFFIMLLFMTYNGWVMIAVALGAMLGYLVWGDDEPSGKSVACH